MGAIQAAFALIQSSLKNDEFVNAKLYASTLWEIINHKYDNKIPEDQRQEYIAQGAYFLAKAILRSMSTGQRHVTGRKAESRTRGDSTRMQSVGDADSAGWG